LEPLVKLVTSATIITHSPPGGEDAERLAPWPTAQRGAVAG
jgi:hypothetical protein